MKNIRSVSALLLILNLVYGMSAYASPGASEILAKADAVRNPGDSYLMKVSVQSGKDLEDQSVFKVQIQGGDRTLIRTLEPARDRGRNLLMLKEEMWAYIPNLKRAVRVSLNQKLTGQAANGDISRMRWSGDYASVVEKETPKEWILFLSANKKDLTYDKIRVWVEKGSFRPKKAQFLTMDGKPLKEAAFEDYRIIAGAERPGTIRIQDALRPDDLSLIKVQEMAVKSFPDSTFNQNSLSE